ncbi:hypothetical protein FXF09_17105 [Vibrio cholerae]|uniref:Uncharacterized protein n=1 Tax=Vibrio cholerae TaxID=666 RepID=A0A5Q6PC60_VIBCL|nr:hypothetical protein [Vibrio cholerae]EGR0288067.1 hypothetical protein [Vibrio cholerae]EGR0452398.1 hypothetical protein [Vibrio cholerae]EIF5160871.1 hypothetical protein [Vibrio cholerae]EIK2269821.1 hypothetical protein [Vibrio cholerae]
MALDVWLSDAFA